MPEGRISDPEHTRMRRSSMFPRSTLRRSPPDRAIDAGALTEAARGLASALPSLAQQAEAGGLQLVAQHLNKALQLAQRVAASGAVQPPRN